ncbi:hypothetical protein [Thermococcus camini]|uniref:Uncharacterized protein n=1 Tax=Thermococcus camini TaxID=2016373 RepID=A0A7G2DE33_9EURY|nr:hypothetical protein [Thermococcus camini]CAD5245264.1 exported protein of unknown function [Thermococcus camini]
MSWRRGILVGILVLAVLVAGCLGGSTEKATPTKGLTDVGGANQGGGIGEATTTNPGETSTGLKPTESPTQSPAPSTKTSTSTNTVGEKKYEIPEYNLTIPTRIGAFIETVKAVYVPTNETYYLTGGAIKVVFLKPDGDGRQTIWPHPEFHVKATSLTPGLKLVFSGCSVEAISPSDYKTSDEVTVPEDSSGFVYVHLEILIDPHEFEKRDEFAFSIEVTTMDRGITVKKTFVLPKEELIILDGVREWNKTEECDNRW